MGGNPWYQLSSSHLWFMIPTIWLVRIWDYQTPGQGTLRVRWGHLDQCFSGVFFAKSNVFLNMLEEIWALWSSFGEKKKKKGITDALGSAATVLCLQFLAVNEKLLNYHNFSSAGFCLVLPIPTSACLLFENLTWCMGCFANRCEGFMTYFDPEAEKRCSGSCSGTANPHH